MPKLVRDNLKTDINHPGFYDPAINHSYLELARHYSIGMMPARVRKPRVMTGPARSVEVPGWVTRPQAFFAGSRDDRGGQ